MTVYNLPKNCIDFLLHTQPNMSGHVTFSDQQEDIQFCNQSRIKFFMFQVEISVFLFKYLLKMEQYDLS